MAIEELQAETINVQVKRRTPTPSDRRWLLVHDGTGVLKLAGPTAHATVAAEHTALLGTKEELEAEIERRKLTPQREYRQALADARRPTAKDLQP